MGEQIVGSKISGTSYGYVAIPDRLVEKVGRIDDGETVNNPLENFKDSRKRVDHAGGLELVVVALL